MIAELLIGITLNKLKELINKAMKELSIEEKAKAYDEAIDKVAYFIRKHIGIGCMIHPNSFEAKELFNIFPRLKESEDERIRAAIIHFISHTPTVPKGRIGKETMIAWLEKQEGCEYVKKDWLEHIKQSWYKEGFIDGKYTPKELTINDVATLNELIDFLENGTAKLQHDLTLYANWLKTQFSINEKQGKQKPADGVKPKFNVGDTMRTLQEANDGYTDGMPVVVSIDNEYYHCTNELIAIKDQDDYEFPPINMKQNPDDKVEPKFRNGQWIVWQDKCYKVNYNDCGYELVDQNGLSTSLEYGTIDEKAHIWDITKDAKDGDVLSYRDGQWIFIYKEKIDDSSFYYHALYSTIHQDLTINDSAFTLLGDAIIPATKEQRDTLIKAMTGAGYTFDFDKKELKKIEQKLAWSEEDEKMLEYALDMIEWYSGKNEDKSRLVSDWLKSLRLKS